MKNIVIFITLMFLGANASAVTLKSLYDVAIDVESQSGTVRDKAISDAFSSLLVKVTGQTDIVDQEAGAELMSKAKQFVRSFRYQQIEEQPVDAIISPWKTEEEESTLTMKEPEPETESIVKQRLIVSFDEKAVGNALWKAKLPVWGKTRPTTLLWVAFQDSEKRMLLGANQKNELQPYVQNHALKRGLPLRYPRLDDEDKKNINITDVWGAYKEPVKMASMRYATEAVATAQLKLNKDNAWEARWSLLQGDDAEYWRVDAADIQQALEKGIDELAQRIAKRYVQVAVANDGDTLIYISDVSNVFDYNRISKYLNGLAGVKNAELIQVQANDVVFRLELRSSARQLKQSIALGKTLAPQDLFAMESQEARFSYRLKP